MYKADKNLLIRYIINKSIRQKLETRNNIVYAQVNITNLCNNHCYHCYLKGKKFQETDISAFIDIIKRINIYSHTQNKLLMLDLIGGDPLLKPNILNLLAYLSSENINYGIKGNPYLLSSYIENLDELQCKRYQMSLDGLPNTHDYIRSKGSFESTLKAIKLLHLHRIPVTIKYTITNQNQSDLWPLLYKLYEENIYISHFLVSRYHDYDNRGFNFVSTYFETQFSNIKSFYAMQIENHDIKIHIDLKEHLWIPFLTQKNYLFNDFFEITSIFPYLPNCSMLSENTFWIDADGYFDVCPKITGFSRTKDIFEYISRRREFSNYLKKFACIGCMWKVVCMGCPAFYTKTKPYRDQGCLFYQQALEERNLN